MNAFILTMIILVNSGTASVSTIVQEYGDKDKCETAKAANRDALTAGRVILATCTKR